MAAKDDLGRRGEDLATAFLVDAGTQTRWRVAVRPLVDRRWTDKAPRSIELPLQ